MLIFLKGLAFVLVTFRTVAKHLTKAMQERRGYSPSLWGRLGGRSLRHLLTFSSQAGCRELPGSRPDWKTSKSSLNGPPPLARLRLQKIPQPSKIAPPVGAMSKHTSLRGTSHIQTIMTFWNSCLISCLGTPTGIAQIGSPFVNTADGILPTELKVLLSESAKWELQFFSPYDTQF